MRSAFLILFFSGREPTRLVPPQASALRAQRMETPPAAVSLPTAETEGNLLHHSWMRSPSGWSYSS
eukprot:1189006-Prorocentrum_minimum.AAC.10